MKKKILSIMTSAAMTLSVLSAVPVNAEELYVPNVVIASDSLSGSFSITELNGVVSGNIYANDYRSNYGSVVNSYLNENEDGTLTRLEYIDGSVIVETYEKDGTPVSSDSITPELDIFGGAFFGEQYNFLVFGQVNSSESDDTEVLRIVKYSKDWEKADSLSIYGANTYIPFDAGSLRMTETGGKLYIHTCHEMYESEDGYNHQANMTFVVNQEDMTEEDSFYDVMNISVGYASHSFNQYIQTDDDYIYRVDHGDAYPRGISITKCSASGSVTNVSYTIPVEFAGSIGNNYTGARVGGFELGNNNCIIAYSTVAQADEPSSCHNIKIAVTDKEFENTEIITFTDYEESDGMSVGTPHLVKFSDSEFLLMWYEHSSNESTDVIKYVTIDENGAMTSDIYSDSTSSVSDCHPVYCSDGLVRWYVTDGSAPLLYAVDPLALDGVENEPEATDPVVTTTIPNEPTETTTTTVTSDISDTDYMIGDANLDGVLNVRDCAYIAHALVNGIVDTLPSTSDYNQDGRINVRDCAAIAQFLINSGF